jgi:hypothetical protein
MDQQSLELHTQNECAHAVDRRLEIHTQNEFDNTNFPQCQNCEPNFRLSFFVMSQSSFLLATSNDVWRVIGSFFVFTRHELTQVFPFVSSLFRLRARELWSKFAHKSIFAVAVRPNNIQWINNHWKFIRKMSVHTQWTDDWKFIRKMSLITRTFPNVKTVRTNSLDILPSFPFVRKVVLDDPTAHRWNTTFPHVKYLYLIGHDSALLECFPNLQHLVLAGLNMRMLNDDMKYCPNLQWLRIANCPNLQSISVLEHLQRLQALHVSRCYEMDVYESEAWNFIKNLDYVFVGGKGDNLDPERWFALEQEQWKSSNQQTTTHGAQ